MQTDGFEVDILQIADDSVMKENRRDGTGWDWRWADWRRDWMDATPNRHAYRCLPLTILNQTGWWVLNPVGFTVVWRGSHAPGSMDFRFDAAPEEWSRWVTDQFGEGIVTWNTPFLFRTRPIGSRLLIAGPANHFKPDAQPLTALIESDWMTMSFTMNWKLARANQAVRFEAGEPLFQAIPLSHNPCADLETAQVRYRRLIDDPEASAAYHEWDQQRRGFHEKKARGEVRPDGWQKDYFQGKAPAGASAPDDHMTKVRPPRILRDGDEPGG